VIHNPVIQQKPIFRILSYIKLHKNGLCYSNASYNLNYMCNVKRTKTVFLIKGTNEGTTVQLLLNEDTNLSLWSHSKQIHRMLLIQWRVLLRHLLLFILKNVTKKIFQGNLGALIHIS